MQLAGCINSLLQDIHIPMTAVFGDLHNVNISIMPKVLWQMLKKAKISQMRDFCFLNILCYTNEILFDKSPCDIHSQQHHQY